MKTLPLILWGLALAASPAFASTLFLPNPAGSTVVAAWVPTNAAVVNGDLQYDGPWLSSFPAGTVLPARYTDGSAAWNLTTTFTGTNATGANAIYTLNRMNVAFTVATTNFAGPAFDRVILQLTPNSDNNRDLQLDASLTIGGVTYSAAQAAFTNDRTFGGNFSDPANRYNGHFGGLALVTYEWDLGALGFAGDRSSVSLSWSLPQTHTALYDAQVSFAAVPEPATYGLIGVGLVALAAGRMIRRRREARES